MALSILISVRRRFRAAPALAGLAWGQIFSDYGGTIISGADANDCLTARFEQVPNAAAAATALVKSDPACMVAMHASDLQGADIHTDRAVAQAQGLAAIANPRQWLATSVAAELLAASDGALRLRDRGYHRLRDLQHTVHVSEVLSDDDPGVLRPLNSLEKVLHNLPVLTTEFVGREADVTALGHRLSVARVVTLVGPGGSGKTRLALQVAAEAVEQFPDGLWLVELAGLADPSLLWERLAQALGIGEVQNGTVQAAVLEACRPSRLLVLLDNCEHLIDASAQVVDRLVRTCPCVSVLATSREPLKVDGENVWPTQPLSLPERCGATDMWVEAAICRAEAGQLFLRRTVAVRSDFRLTPENAVAVGRLLHQVEGIPLAIEMAAACLRSIGVEELAANLHDRFTWLRNGRRGRERRHESLRATVAWSYDLLPPGEQALWRALSVFPGGFTVAAAQAVGSGELVTDAEVPHCLHNLVEKSIVRVEVSRGAARYRMLETIRQFGLEALVESGEEHHVRLKHLQWCLSFVQSGQAVLDMPSETAWFDVLEIEHDNFRSALQWAKSDPQVIRYGFELAAELGAFWHVRVHVREGLNILEELLQEPPKDCPPRLLLRVIGPAGTLAKILGRNELARERWEQALALASAHGLQRGKGSVLNNLGLLALEQGRYAEAGRQLQESLELWRNLDSKQQVARVLINLAELARQEKQYDKAKTLYDEGLALWHQLGADRGISTGHKGLGALAYDQGKYDDAQNCLAQALRHARMAHDRGHCLECVGAFGRVALARGATREAIRLFGAIAAEARSSELDPTTVMGEAYLQVRERLGAEEYQALMDEGARVPLEVIMQELESGHLAQEEPAPEKPVRKVAQRGGLTEREMDVVQLVVQGLTDREVAEQLHVSRHTVNNHLRNIYGKLGISNRSALVSWAFRVGVSHEGS